MRFADASPDRPDVLFPNPHPSVAPMARAVVHHRDPAMPEGGHRARSVAELAARLGVLRGAGAIVRANDPRAAGAYAVPDSTLLAQEATRMGIAGPGDLFGGVVPGLVVAGKAITHPRLGASAACPESWSDGFAWDVAPHALAGLSVFTLEDAAAAALLLLSAGPVRAKPAWADGGRGQAVLHAEADIARMLEALDGGCLAACGLVLEEDLADAVTFSVGRVRLGAVEITYVGTQSMTTDNASVAVYGGSRLFVVPGGFAELAAAPLPDALHRAAGHARAYDEAADRHFPGFFASRRNYDVVLGRDARGRSRAGVLEQSWRIGGASGAEIAALKAFAADPGLRSVVASCHERYGPAANPPPEADIYCHADDPEVGFITKYAIIESRSHAE